MNRTYNPPIVGVLPEAPEMLELGSGGLFTLRSPDHPLSRELRPSRPHSSSGFEALNRRNEGVAEGVVQPITGAASGFSTAPFPGRASIGLEVSLSR